MTEKRIKFHELSGWVKLAIVWAWIQAGLTAGLIALYIYIFTVMIVYI